MIGGAFHWPTALVVLGAVALCWALVALRRQQRARGFVSDVDRATYQTLHTASLAATHLTGGLSAEDAEEAAEPLRAMLGTPALAICDRAGLVAWDGAGGAAHRRQAFDHAGECIHTGRTSVVRSITCADPDCLVQTAVVAPLVVDEAVVGSLAAYGPQASPGLARATEEVARYVSSQLEAAAVGRERGRAMEAELRALRAQISPHFIYNSLAATASFVRTDPERARELLLEFADFTRYALRRGGAYTTLSEELRNVERYLVLEQARFGDRLGVHLLIAPEVLPVAIPYLVVQPLVENAVRHGLAPKVGPGSVTITAADAGSEAVITVEDDGVGADPATIQRVLDGDVCRDSVGLGNVDARLRQVYGDDHGLAPKVGPGSVTITAADAGSDAVITVEDDGVGADPATIQRVLDGDVGRDSVGLGNVDARLRQVYGDDHGLVVETAPEAGMKVSFTVPKFAPGVVASA